MLILDFFSF